MIVLVLTAVGVASAAFSRRRIRRLAELPIDGLWLVWAAFITQIVVFEFVGYYIPVVASNVLHLVTYALCLTFLYRNRHLPGGWIIMLGASCNLAAIAANGGTMPADADAWANAGLPEPTAFENSSFATDANLALLGDMFYIPAGWPLANVFSLGDVLIVIGGSYLAHRWCRSDADVTDERDTRVVPTADGPSSTAAAGAATIEPVPADLEQLAAAVNELRTVVHERLDAIVGEAAALRDEARADVHRTRDALLTLIDEIGRSSAPSATDASPELRLDTIERRLEENQRALERTVDHQRQLADTVAAVVDMAIAEA